MSLHRIALFAVVAKHLNITRASRDLHISQPALSQQLKLLQGEFGVTLFSRSGAGIELTEDGRRFLNQAEPIMFYYEKLKANFTPKPRVRAAEEIVIGGSYGPAALLLPSVMALFQKNHPSAQVKLHVGDSREVEKMVLKYRVEFGLITNPSALPSLDIRPYREQKFIAFVPVNHPWAKARKLSLKEFLSAPLIVRTSKEGKCIAADLLAKLTEPGVEPNIFMRYESPDAVKIAVRNGLGVGILFQDVIEEDLGKGLFKRLRVDGKALTSGSYIVSRKDKPLSAHAAELVNLLRAWPQKRGLSKKSPHAA